MGQTRTDLRLTAWAHDRFLILVLVSPAINVFPTKLAIKDSTDAVACRVQRICRRPKEMGLDRLGKLLAA
jgi:hypothetical protein